MKVTHLYDFTDGAVADVALRPLPNGVAWNLAFIGTEVVAHILSVEHLTTLRDTLTIAINTINDQVPPPVVAEPASPPEGEQKGPSNE